MAPRISPDDSRKRQVGCRFQRAVKVLIGLGQHLRGLGRVDVSDGIDFQALLVRNKRLDIADTRIAHDLPDIIIQRHVENCRDILGDVLLHCERVIECPFVILRPKN